MTEFEKRLEELNDDALIRMITVEAHEYTEEALEAVNNELTKRNIDYSILQEEYHAKLCKEKEAKHDELDEPVLLTTVSNDSQAEVIISLLESFGIPVLDEGKGTGSNLGFGQKFVGFVDENKLYVPSKFLEKAKEILGNRGNDSEKGLSENEPQNEYFEESENGQANESYDNIGRKQRSIISWILLIILGVPILVGIVELIMFLIYIISHSKQLY